MLHKLGQASTNLGSPDDPGKHTACQMSLLKAKIAQIFHIFYSRTIFHLPKILFCLKNTP
jgi:hypothetical protein